MILFTLLHYSMEVLLFNNHKPSFSDVGDKGYSELGAGCEKQAGNTDLGYECCRKRVRVRVQKHS